jgi:hypothetical protein
MADLSTLTPSNSIGTYFERLAHLRVPTLKYSSAKVASFERKTEHETVQKFR